MNTNKNVTFTWVFKKLLLPRKKSLLIGLLLVLIGRVSSLVLPGASKYLIDDVIKNSDLGMLKILLVVVVSAILIQASISFLITRLINIQAQYVVSQLKVKVQKKILSLPIGYFDSTKSGMLVSRIMHDVESVHILIGSALLSLIGGTIAAVISLVLLLKISVLMTLFALIPISFFFIIMKVVVKRVRPIYKKEGEIRSDVVGRLTETLNGIRVIKSFNAEEKENKIFEKGILKLYDNSKLSMTASALLSSSAIFLLGLAFASILGIGGYYVINGDNTIGDFFAFTLYLGYIIAVVTQLNNNSNSFINAFAKLDRTEEILNMNSETLPNQRPITLDSIHGDIEFQNVSFAYSQGKTVLHDLNFKTPQGSITALIGSSGSGKSTTTSLIATFIAPQSGLITIDGHDLTQVNLESYRKHLGIVLQDDFLFEGTIRENIIFSQPNASEEDIQVAVKGAYLNEFVDHFEDGLETVIGERAVKLSGGQRQRVSIARTILANPKIIILDEATSNLDTESELYLQKSLNTLMKNRTTFIIAHRLSTIRQADQILVIEKGRIVETGTHDELMASKTRYYTLYTHQSRI